jgi:hypothetical protein
MKPHNFAKALVVMAVAVLLFPRGAYGDILKFADGTTVEGSVQKIEKGQVKVQVGQEIKMFDVLAITDIEFDSPRLATGTSRLPLEHFLTSMESQEMLGHFRDVESSAAAIRKLLDQTKTEWSGKSIAFNDTAKWATAKERFTAPLSLYQERLNDLYFHVLGKVDEYNTLMKEADVIYVGVKGWFQAGSSLIPSDKRKLPLKKYVPGNWYDSIFFEGYDRGYSEAYEKYSREPYSQR